MKRLLRFILRTSFLNIPIQHIVVPVFLHKKKLARILSNITYHKALDYGCGEGTFSTCFTAQKYHGFDIDAERISYSKSKYRDHAFSTDIPVLQEYDLIFFNNFLHHINEENIESLLKKISEAKKDNTHILIIEMFPPAEQKSFLFRIVLKLEAYTHYSNPRPLDYYRKVLQKYGFHEQSVDVMNRFFILHYN